MGWNWKLLCYEPAGIIIFNVAKVWNSPVNNWPKIAISIFFPSVNFQLSILHFLFFTIQFFANYIKILVTKLALHQWNHRQQRQVKQSTVYGVCHTRAPEPVRFHRFRVRIEPLGALTLVFCSTTRRQTSNQQRMALFEQSPYTRYQWQVEKSSNGALKVRTLKLVSLISRKREWMKTSVQVNPSKTLFGQCNLRFAQNDFKLF